SPNAEMADSGHPTPDTTLTGTRKSAKALITDAGASPAKAISADVVVTDANEKSFGYSLFRAVTACANLSCHAMTRSSSAAVTPWRAAASAIASSNDALAVDAEASGAGSA